MRALGVVGQGTGHDQPAQAQSRRQGLRHAADVGDPPGVEALQRADGLAVVAELGVVVVLDDQAVAVRRPGEELAPALAAEHDAGGELVRRRYERRVGGQLPDDHAVGIELARHELEAERPDLLVQAVVRGVLDRDAPPSARGEDAQQQVHRLGGALDDEDLVGIGDDAARASEVVGERLAQRVLAARLAVAERERPRLPGGLLDAAEPEAQRKERHVRRRRRQVVARLAPRRRGRELHRALPGDRGDHGRCARARLEEALGLELEVGIAGDAARHAELQRERTRRGEPDARAQRAVADRVAQRSLQRDAQGLASPPLEREPSGLVGVGVCGSLHGASMIARGVG